VFARSNIKAARMMETHSLVSSGPAFPLQKPDRYQEKLPDGPPSRGFSFTLTEQAVYAKARPETIDPKTVRSLYHMRLGIIGLPQSGKTTVFEALTRSVAADGNRQESRIGTITVPDKRVEMLSEMYNPRKTIFTQVEYFLPGKGDHGGAAKKDQGIWTQVRDCDALIHVVRNFSGYGMDAPTPKRGCDGHRPGVDHFRSGGGRKTPGAPGPGRAPRQETQSRGDRPAETAARKHLDNEIPLRRFPEIATAKLLRGFAFFRPSPC
jgi:hypothetical protein